MSVSVILRRLARAEFDDAADWYEARRAGRGAAFTTAVRQVLSAIGSHPEAHPEVYGDVREALVPSYPYAVSSRRTSMSFGRWPPANRVRPPPARMDSA
jgi:plasmid stabilization system protein ParE